MAKSSRSKWKKAHRREKANREKRGTRGRVLNLNRKLKLAAEGKSSTAPPQEPERRFHFLNPEFAENVAHPLTKYYLPNDRVLPTYDNNITSNEKNGEKNYATTLPGAVPIVDYFTGKHKTAAEQNRITPAKLKGEYEEKEEAILHADVGRRPRPQTNFHTDPDLQSGDIHDFNNIRRQHFGVRRIDFNAPLQLSAPRSNYHGKSDPTAPHPQTVQYEKIDADLPLAGHAFTKYDLERLEAKRKQQQEQQEQQQEGEGERENEQLDKNNNNKKNSHSAGGVSSSSHAAGAAGKRKKNNDNDNEEEDDDNNSDGPVEFEMNIGDGFDESQIMASRARNQKSKRAIRTVGRVAGGGETESEEEEENNSDSNGSGDDDYYHYDDNNNDYHQPSSSSPSPSSKGKSKNKFKTQRNNNTAAAAEAAKAVVKGKAVISSIKSNTREVKGTAKVKSLAGGNSNNNNNNSSKNSNSKRVVSSGSRAAAGKTANPKMAAAKKQKK